MNKTRRYCQAFPEQQCCLCSVHVTTKSIWRFQKRQNFAKEIYSIAALTVDLLHPLFTTVWSAEPHQLPPSPPTLNSFLHCKLHKMKSKTTTNLNVFLNFMAIFQFYVGKISFFSVFVLFRERKPISRCSDVLLEKCRRRRRRNGLKSSRNYFERVAWPFTIRRRTKHSLECSQNVSKIK